MIPKMGIIAASLRMIGAVVPPIPVPTGDPYFDKVALLLHMDGANNSTVFTDNSPTPKTVTVSGDAKISTTQSKFGGASGYFDGTGDYLTVPHNAGLSMDSSDFTIELFVYKLSSKNAYLFSKGGVGGSSYANWVWYTDSAGKLAFNIYNTGSGLGNLVGSLTSASSLPINQWVHLAVVKQGSIVKMYVNGVESASTTISGSLNDGSALPLQIGNEQGQSAAYNYDGYMDEIRITKGVARYTANFTPPTQAFPNQGVVVPDSDYSKVALLLHMDGANGSTTFTDNSPSPKTPTLTGTPLISTVQSKFGGASAELIGTDRIDFSNPNLVIGTDAFTIEGWFMPDSNTNRAFVSWAAGGHLLYVASGNWAWFNGGNAILGGVATANVWYHVALTRDGTGMVRMFINGVQIGSVSYPSSMGGSGDFYVGWYNSGNPAGGYYDEVRVTKGIARYTADFTPPTAPFSDVVYADPNYANVALLLHMDGVDGSTSFTDNSPTPKVVTASGGAKISTTQSKFGGAAGLFDGVDDVLQATSSDFIFGTGDFTIELFIYPTGAAGDNGVKGLLSTKYSAGVPWVALGYTSSSSMLTLATNTNTPTYSGIARLVWSHVAIVRQSGVLYVYINGVKQATTSNSTGNFTNSDVYVGGSDANFYPNKFPGYIDELRITKGIARYTADFTPPTQAFPNQGVSASDPNYANVVLLLHLDGADNSTVITDNSPKVNQITVAGGAKISATQSKFGGASCSFDGVNSYFNTVESADFALGSTYTFEFFIYIPQLPSAGQTIYLLGLSGFEYVVFGSSGRLTLNTAAGTLSSDILPTGRWLHVAFVGSGTTTSWYLDGVLSGSNETMGSFGSNIRTLTIGSFQKGGDARFNGYIDELRVTKGVARYTANFTPPTQAFPNS